MRHTALSPAVKPSNPSSPPRSAGRAVGGIRGFGARILAAGPARPRPYSDPARLCARIQNILLRQHFSLVHRPPGGGPRARPGLALGLLAKRQAEGPGGESSGADIPDLTDESAGRSPLHSPMTRERRSPHRHGRLHRAAAGWSSAPGVTTPISGSPRRQSARAFRLSPTTPCSSAAPASSYGRN